MSFQINSDISKASTLPKEFYLQDKFFYFSLKKIFPDSWQFITDIETLQVSKIYPFILLPDSVNEPLFFIKEQNQIMLFNYAIK